MRTSVAVLCLFAALVLVASAPAVAQKHVFATASGNFSGNLGGLGGADAACQSAAETAGLSPGSEIFIAWLSDDGNDAWCRVQGLAGKRGDGCVGGTPEGAGPWVRVGESVAWSNSLEELTTMGPRLPLNKDETGTLLQLFGGGSIFAWSSTELDGALHPLASTCTGWSDPMTLGAPYLAANEAVSRAWTDAFGQGSGCQGFHRLNCIEVGLGAPMQPFPWQPAGLAFVTQGTYTGLLGGLAGADEVCRSEAGAAFLPRSNEFVAYLSTVLVDARDRISDPALPFRRVDGHLVAADRADLVDGRINAPISIYPNGASYLNADFNFSVWTGTLTDGTHAAENCDSWANALTEGSASARAGWLTDSATDWTDSSSLDCTQGQHLYCLLNADLLFWDNFELGNPSRWSATSP